MVFDIFNNFIAVENKMIAALQLKTHNLYDHNKYDMIRVPEIQNNQTLQPDQWIDHQIPKQELSLV